MSLDNKTEWVISELLNNDPTRTNSDGNKIVDLLRSTLPTLFNSGKTISSANILSILDSTPLDLEPGRAAALSQSVEFFIERFEVLDNVASLYTNARLPRSMLEDEDRLVDYIHAAESGKESARPFLDFLTSLQDPVGTRANVFAAILASSGTGKTQLAATASLTYNEATTIYLLCSQASQRFYDCHSVTVAPLQAAIAEFQQNLRSKPSVAKIKNWANSTNDRGTSSFVNMLYRILVNPKTKKTRIKLADLKKEIVGTKYLVFLDEVPAKGATGFDETECLRDTLRYLGIAPVLLSTHTGSQGYLMGGSRNSESPWMYTLSRLPAFAPFPTKNIQKSIFKRSERPLILGTALTNDKGQKTLPQIVQQVRSKLQSGRPDAWTFDPALQLVQLFYTDVDIYKSDFEMAHNLVGHHFGALNQAPAADLTCGARTFSCAELAQFHQTLSVAPVDGKYEPLLYLALVTWDETMLSRNPDTMFPLVDKNRRPLTVIGAFEKCKHLFTPKATFTNSEAVKANGDLLEVLVHASLTLASMKPCTNDNQYLPGVLLDEYIPLVRRLMSDPFFQSLPQQPALFEQINFDWPTVPALGGSNTWLPAEITHDTVSCLGFLSRARDGAMVDGQIWNMKRDEEGKAITGSKEASPFISVECKNWKNGVGATEFQNIFKRIKVGIKCSLIFVSSLESPGLFTNTDLSTLKRECFKHHDSKSITVLLWKKGEEEPTFLKVKNSSFCPSSRRVKTELLVVIFVVGLISPQTTPAWGVGETKKRKMPPCANYPFKDDE